MTNNKEIFKTVELDYWASNQGLLLTEKYVIEKYLTPNGKTLEAGTGGGRIALEMSRLGFKSIYAFDYVPELIERAKQKDPAGKIAFAIEDATGLKYLDNSFEQLVYLQQILCCIEDKLGRLKALTEAYRVLKAGGTALFSLLNFEARLRNPVYAPYIFYLNRIRKLSSTPRSIQSLPWLKHNGKLNWKALVDRGPYMYWYTLQEAYDLFNKVNFKVIALGSDLQLSQQKMHTSLTNLAEDELAGMLYFVCQK